MCTLLPYGASFFALFENPITLSGKKCGVSFAALLLCLASLQAQQLPIRNYTVKDGLVRNAVRSILQDSGGWMWFGTTDGLVRYDGATFRVFTTQQGLTDNYINTLTADSTGSLWIATNFGGLGHLHTGRFTAFYPDSENLASFSNHINCLLPESNSGYLVGTDYGMFRFAGYRFTTVVPRIPVTTLARDSSGTVWIGTPNGLMRLVHGQGEEEVTVMVAEWEITALACDRLGMMWVGTSHGLRFRLPETSHRWQLERLARYVQNQWIRCISIDKDNTAWLGTAQMGVVRFSPDGMITQISEANGLAGNVVNAIVRDSESNVWIATSTGLSKLISEHIVNFTRAHGLPDHAATAVTRDATGAMWFGTRLGLARMLDGVMTTPSVSAALSSPYVLTLFTDADGTVWCGTEDGPAQILPEHGGRARIHAFGPHEGWRASDGKPNRVRAIYQDASNKLWFGNDEGISLFSNGRFFTHRLKGHYGERLVAGLVRDNGGDLWVGLHAGGIIRFAVAFDRSGEPKLRQRCRIGVGDGLADDRIRCAMKARDGSLWFATRFGGVTRILVHDSTSFTFRSFTSDDGLASNWITGIAEDQGGNIWLATSGGVTRLVVPASPSESLSVHTLTVFDGLAGDGVSDVYADVNGTLWFATYNGVTRYDPSGDMPPRVPPRVLITSISILGQPDTAGLHTLQGTYDYDHHSIAFEYVGISFRDEARVRYRYMLEGFDTTWSLLTERRYVQYTHLPAGEYVFRVRAQNGLGIWSTSAATFSFTIVPPIWSRWWFITAVLVFAVGLLWLGHRYRVRQLLTVERLRLRIAADLHDDLGSTLSSIAIAGDLARREITSPSPRATEALQRITASARSMLEHLDDIVWSIHPANDSLDDLVLRMRAFAAELLEPNDIAYTLSTPQQGGDIPMEMRRQIYLIFKEALHNVVKHAACSQVYIGLEMHDGTLELTVRDNGSGFVIKPEYPGNGLHTMHARTTGMGGTLSINSTCGIGTTVRVRLPIT